MSHHWEHTMPARSLRPSSPQPTQQHQKRLDAVEARLKLCRWSAALSLGVGIAAWCFANVSADSGTTSLAVFTAAVLVCLIATGAGSLLESERERLQNA
jgi:4-hydroxybenzoate polyprenyltransferase